MKTKLLQFHVSDYGTFGGGIPADMDGVAYTTWQGWMRANLDWADCERRNLSCRLDRCKKLAAKTRRAVSRADKAITRCYKSE